MEFLKETVAVMRIAMAVFVPCGKGGHIHQDRAYHGLAYNDGCDTTYRFDTGEVICCRSGEVIYLPKGSNYTVDKNEIPQTCDAGVYAINFLISSDSVKFRPQKLSVRGRDKMLSLFKRAVSSWRRKEVGYFEECFADLYKIFKQIKQESAVYSSSAKSFKILKPALEYINEHYATENIRMSDLASLCGISEPYLRRVFHKVYSVSPAVYIRNLRIDYAKELLILGGCSVTDAAFLSGFGDVSYFSREFKKTMGISPKDYLSEGKREK